MPKRMANTLADRQTKLKLKHCVSVSRRGVRLTDKAGELTKRPSDWLRVADFQRLQQRNNSLG